MRRPPGLAAPARSNERGEMTEQVESLIALAEHFRGYYQRQAIAAAGAAENYRREIKRLLRVGKVEDLAKWCVGTVVRWDMESRAYRGQDDEVARAAIKFDSGRWMLTGTGLIMSDAELRSLLEEDQCCNVELLSSHRKIKGEL